MDSSSPPSTGPCQNGPPSTGRLALGGHAFARSPRTMRTEYNPWMVLPLIIFMSVTCFGLMNAWTPSQPHHADITMHGTSDRLRWDSRFETSDGPGSTSKK